MNIVSVAKNIGDDKIQSSLPNPGYIRRFLDKINLFIKSDKYSLIAEPMLELCNYVYNNKIPDALYWLCIIVLLVWIIGIGLMGFFFSTIVTNKTDPTSASEFSKIIYSWFHATISFVLLLYIIIKTESFKQKYNVKLITVGGVNQTPPAEISATISTKVPDAVKVKNKYTDWFIQRLVDFIIILTTIPHDIRQNFEQIYNSITSKFDTGFDGANYQTQINLGVAFKLVVAHFPSILFFVVLTSVVSMIKAYHKILCGNSNSGVIIDWQFKFIDIVIYAIFRIVAFIILIMSISGGDKSLLTRVALAIFYFTLVYLIIRFILLLYENMFSNTIVSLYKWDIRDSDCTSNTSGPTGNWILDPAVRQQVKNEQNLKNPNKFTNDIFSLIFNILVVIFLSAVSIISASAIFTITTDEGKEAFTKILKVSSELGYRTMHTQPSIILQQETQLSKSK
jgi:hypothetical protein